MSRMNAPSDTKSAAPKLNVEAVHLSATNTDNSRRQRTARRRRKQRAAGYFTTVIVSIAALILNAPLIGALLASFRTPGELTQGAISLPFTFSLGNYRQAFSKGFDLTPSLLNSLMISVGTVLLVLFITYPAAFAIVRMSNRRSRLLQIVSSTRLLPGIFFVIPLYLVFVEIGLLDTIGGMILVNSFAQITIALLIFVPAFAEFPKEIEEAAVIDGGGVVRILTTICAPILAPSIVAVSIVTFLFSWSDYLYALILTGSTSGPVTVRIFQFVTSYDIFWGAMCAAAVISVIAPIIVCASMQRYLVKGLTAGAVKG